MSKVETFDQSVKKGDLPVINPAKNDSGMIRSLFGTCP